MKAFIYGGGAIFAENIVRRDLYGGYSGWK